MGRVAGGEPKQNRLISILNMAMRKKKKLKHSSEEKTSYFFSLQVSGRHLQEIAFGGLINDMVAVTTWTKGSYLVVRLYTSSPLSYGSY